MSVLNTILKQSNTVVGELKGMNTALKTMGARDKTAYRLDHQQRKYEREQDKEEPEEDISKNRQEHRDSSPGVQADDQNQEKQSWSCHLLAKPSIRYLEPLLLVEIKVAKGTGWRQHQ